MNTIDLDHHTELPYLHDTRLRKFEYDEKGKSIVMNLLNEFDDIQEYKLTFEDVHGFEMQACDFWGPSTYIASFILLSKEQRKIANQLKALQDQHKGDWFSPRCGDLDQCIEAEFCMASGNTLNILCRAIKVDRQVRFAANE